MRTGKERVGRGEQAKYFGALTVFCLTYLTILNSLPAPDFEKLFKALDSTVNSTYKLNVDIDEIVGENLK